MSIITTDEIKLAERIAKRAAGKWQAADVEDVTQHLLLWIMTHQQAIARWRAESHGEAKLFVTLRREAAKFCADEQTHAAGKPLRTENFYSTELLDRALPFIFEDTPVTVANEHPQTGQTYSHGTAEDFGNAQAILADIRGAFYGLNSQIRHILELRYRDGLTLEEIGELSDLSKVGVKKRIERALERLRDALSGDKP